jgi:hypothetical protein
MTMIEPFEGVSREELIDLERRLGDQVAAFSTVITKVPFKDTRDPPGDLHGTGWFIEIEHQKFVLTCEHVAREQTRSMLCASFHGSEVAFDLRNPVSALTYPLDVAITAITENTWRLVEHQAQCIPMTLFTELSPVSDELMYVAGYPGELGRVWPGMRSNSEEDGVEAGIQMYTTAAMVCQIQEEFDPVLDEELPQPREEIHFLLPYTPEYAEYMSNGQRETLPRAPGLSGSLVWNTRYMEIKRSGGVWNPEDARVVGIVWGNSTKAGVLVATPARFMLPFLEHTARNIKAGLPYETAPESINAMLLRKT